MAKIVHSSAAGQGRGSASSFWRKISREPFSRCPKFTICENWMLTPELRKGLRTIAIHVAIWVRAPRIRALRVDPVLTAGTHVEEAVKGGALFGVKSETRGRPGVALLFSTTLTTRARCTLLRPPKARGGKSAVFILNLIPQEFGMSPRCACTERGRCPGVGLFVFTTAESQVLDGEVLRSTARTRFFILWRVLARAATCRAFSRAPKWRHQRHSLM
jgi:hypothetical protein